MKRSTGNIFQTVKTEGAILPAGLLQRIVDGDHAVPGLRAEDYHLGRSERLNEVATRAWNRLQGVWESFKDSMERLPESDIGTSLTRERWLLILFQELGYGRLTTKKAYEIEGKSYPISHEWQKTPIHLVSFRQVLDKRTPGRPGAARISPHSLLQEFLNRSDDHLWGFVSNGRNLRILRDNKSLTRQAYVEFDLQTMMESEAYSDFFLLFLLCHQSRVEVPEGKTPEHCWLEKWYNTAVEEGVRALDQLRKGVQSAIEILGGGFLSHPNNEQLCDRLRTGGLSTQDYYRQVLRQVYRCIFLFVAEDREMLFDPSAPETAKRVYNDYYSTCHIRNLAVKMRGSRHPDLWRLLRLMFKKLHTGCPELGLPTLGSFLFDPNSTADLNETDIANSDLLKAIRSLAFIVDQNILRPINYRNLGPEELGSVYESLLEMHPEINIDAHTFGLTVVAGSERKTTGSYYTPTSLVNCLLDSALEPVVDEALKSTNPEQALLNLKVCDPATGSGHFLIAAAHRLAKRLASVRAGEDEPAPESVSHALHDVIGHCIYGVDINPMAVELCKVNLWLEAIEPGKPLSFLDHHIKCGNSLLGTTPAILNKGILDDAFKPITGDDKNVCNEYRRTNKRERETGQIKALGLFREPLERLGNLTASMVNIDALDDTTIEGIHKKQERYEKFVHSSGYLFGHFWADAWCSAFVWKKSRTFHYPNPITEEIFRQIEDNPYNVETWMREEIQRLASQYKFFQWHLEFPDVFRVPLEGEKPENKQTGWSGGFDVVLGNPPWERIKLQEKEWFATRQPDIANAPNAAARRRMIENLRTENPALYKAFHEDKRKAEGESTLLRDTGRFPLCGRGDVNTYTVFAETNSQIMSSIGRVGCIVPSGIATDDTTKYFFQAITSKKMLVSLYDFENRNGIFPGVHRSYKFCLLTLSGLSRPVKQGAEFIFFALSTDDLREKERRFTLTDEEIKLINPNTKTCPIFRSKRDAELTKAIYRRVPVLIKEGPPEENPWGITFQRMFDMANDSQYFRTREQLEGEGFVLEGNIFVKGEVKYLPLYEGKMVWLFNHRAGSIGYYGRVVPGRHDVETTNIDDLIKADYVSISRFWVEKNRVENRRVNENRWFIGFRDVTNSSSERTLIITIIPCVAVGHKLPLIYSNKYSSKLLTCMILNLSSFVLDYMARQKVGGVAMSYFFLKQFPVINPRKYQDDSDITFISIIEWLFNRSLELFYNAYDLQPFANNCGYDGPPFKWDEERRFLIRCELDSAYFHLYGIEKDDVDYIMETFPIVKKKDEQKYGSYRTKEKILEIYDMMAEAMRTGQEYQTIVEPPPGPPVDAGGNFVPVEEWDEGNWPMHIHRMRCEKEE